jgi:hypothetical protein
MSDQETTQFDGQISTVRTKRKVDKKDGRVWVGLIAGVEAGEAELEVIRALIADQHEKGDLVFKVVAVGTGVTAGAECHAQITALQCRRDVDEQGAVSVVTVFSLEVPAPQPHDLAGKLVALQEFQGDLRFRVRPEQGRLKGV